MESASNYRENIGKISAAMMKIHKLLLEDEMQAREIAANKVIPPTERLNALLNDPDLAWLRALSQLMAYVDEVFFQKEPVLERQIIDIEEKVSHLFSLQNESEFSYRYRNRLGTVPDLMIQHGHLKLTLRKKPTDKN